MKTVSQNTQTKGQVQKITSNDEMLVEGLNYFTANQTTWDGNNWVSYNAQIGDTFYQCLSIEQLQSRVSNHDFTPKNEKLIAKAIEEFGTNA